MNDKNDIWVENFSINRSGYQLIAPAVDDGFYQSIKIMFKDSDPYIKDIIIEWNGVDCLGAFFKEKELELCTNKILEKVKNNIEVAERVNKEAYVCNDKYFSFAKKLKNVNFSNMSDKELGELFKDYIEIHEEAHKHALTTTWFIDSHGQKFSNYLLEKTKEIVMNSGKEIDFAKVFSTLTTCPKNSLLVNEEIESLQVAKEILGDNKAKEVLLNAEDLSSIPNEVPNEIKEEMLNHYQKWLWTPFTYLGPAYEIEYYLTVWKGLVKENTSLDEEINKLKSKPQKIKKERNNLFNEFKISDTDKTIYDLAADITFLKGYRKNVSFHGFYVQSFMLKEMAKRMDLSMNQMYLITPKELVERFVRGKEIDVNEINFRSGYAVWRRPLNGKLKIYTGEKAKKIISRFNIKKEQVDLNVSKLKGTTACSGKAKGIVKIVNLPEEMLKMEEGNIMISHTTFPSLVPAMKKAAAIITEDGGITCHAAIVSRELGTPCITGIKMATKILKDGDLVEVDASKGVVRIIK